VPNRIRHFMDEIQTRTHTNGVLSPNGLNLFQTKKIQIDLQKMAKYFDKLILEISDYADLDLESWIYFLGRSSGRKTLVSYFSDSNFPRFVIISFKTSKVTFSPRYGEDLSYSFIILTPSCSAYPIIDGFLCFSCFSYEMKPNFVDFKLKPLKV
jgi:hypothetical protein